MSGFIATAPTSPKQGVIVNDGWFPDMSIATFRETTRLDGTVTDSRVRAALIDAMLETNQILGAFRAAQSDQGYASLESVPSTAIDGTSRLVMLYRRAVHSTAKADLIERYRDFDSTDSGQRKAEDMSATIDEQRRNARWAVSELLGRPHTTVELI